MMKDIEKITQQLRESQKQFIDAIRPYSKHQDWRMAPTEWSFREVAAHMATTEEDCFKKRIHLIVTNQNPDFDYYLNTGWDFSQIELTSSLEKWVLVREEIFDELQNLAPEAWEFTGNHVTFGEVKLADLLQIMLEHDLGHLSEMQPMMTSFKDQA
ncbi:MAG: DinB family protein [Chloroflexota bacterium]